MSTTLSTAPAPRRTAALLDLARFEARDLLTQIPVLLFGLLYVLNTADNMFSGLVGKAEGMDGYPVLQNVDRDTQSGALLLSLALLVCVNRAALRSRRQHTEEQFDVLPMERARRTLAHALSVVPYAALSALLAVVQFGWAALKPGAAGHGSVAELAVAPLAVLLSGALAVLLARVAPHPVAPALFLVVLYLVVLFLNALTSGAHAVQWLWPTVGEFSSDPIPSGLLGRPAAWHALYLAGLTALCVALAVLVAGGRTRALRAVTVLALAATAAGAVGQAPGDSARLRAAREAAYRTPEKLQSCVDRGGSAYCAFPEWRGWTGHWAAVVDRLQADAGGRAATVRLTVRQRIGEIFDLSSDSTALPSRTPGEVTVGTRWGGNRVPEFAVGVASVLVAGDEDTASSLCDARVVTTMWLALGSDPDPLTTFRHLRVDDSLGGSGVVLAPTGSLRVSAQQTEVVKRLLARPHDEIAARVKAHWTALTSSHTTTAQAAKLLGVWVPKGADDCAGE